MKFHVVYVKYWQDSLPMSAFVAWLWAFPLFGFLQDIISFNEILLLYFNISFLAGTSLCFLFFALSSSWEIKKNIALLGAPVNLVMTLVLVISSSIMPTAFFQDVKLIFFIFFPVVMGIFTASFFVCWGSTIYYIDDEVKGRYMGQMMAAASLLCVVVLLLSLFSIIVSVVFSAVLLILPALQVSKIVEREKKEKKYPAYTREPDSKKQAGEIRLSFWVPLTIILGSFYILSWITHNTIFPFIRAGCVTAPFLGHVIYGVAALAGGYFLDRRRELEYLAILGLVSLGCAFLFLPAAVNFSLLLPMQLLLEASYALIDLFLWVLLAAAALIYGGRPSYYYGMGLFLNLFFIIAGIGFKPFLESLTGGDNVFYMSSLAAAILLCGTIPALALRRVRYRHDNILTAETAMSVPVETLSCEEGPYTPREKEVLNLLLTDLDNTSIQNMLGITRNTLKTHIRHIYGKASVNNRAELIYKFRQSIPGSGKKE